MEYKLILYIFVTLIIVTLLIDAYKERSYILYTIFSAIIAYEIQKIIITIIEIYKQA